MNRKLHLALRRQPQKVIPWLLVSGAAAALAPACGSTPEKHVGRGDGGEGG